MSESTTIERLSAMSGLSHQHVEFDAPMPSPLRTERGEVYRTVTPHASYDPSYDQIRYRLTDEDRAALAKLAGVKESSVPAEVEGGGFPSTIGSKVEFVPFKTKIKGKPVKLRLDTRPELAVLVANMRERVKAEGKAREAFWRRENRDALDGRRQLAESVQATLAQGESAAYYVETLAGEDDGWGEGTHVTYTIYRTLDGREVEYNTRKGMRPADPAERHPSVIILPASAARPPGSIQADRDAALAREEAERTARKSAARDRAAAVREELLRVEVPDKAVAAYKRCAGDPERLPDDIDNPDYWLVKEYADAIEGQGLAYARPLVRPDGLDQLPDAD